MNSMSFESIDKLEEQVTSIQRSGDIICSITPVMQQWPWQTAIPLAKRSLVDAVKSHFESQRVDAVYLERLLVHHVIILGS